MDALVLTLVVIFIPGIIWARLDAKYASQTKPSQFDFTLNIFVFGLTAYVVTFLIYLLPCIKNVASFNLTAIEIGSEEAQGILNKTIVDEIIIATFVSLILSPLWLAINQRKYISRFLQLIKATNRYGDEDVWDFTLNSTGKEARYVNIRDSKTGLTYCGYVEVFSEAPDLRELLLRSVMVYETESATLVLEVPRLYIAREPKEMTIEFPADNTYEWINDPELEDVN